MDKTYEIPIECANSAKELVGKTLCGNGNELKVIDWVGQNYKVQMPNGKISETKVMWILQCIKQNRITVK